MEQWRGGLLAAYCWLTVSFRIVCSDCVDDGICAMYNGLYYKTLDGTLRDDASVECQRSSLPLPFPWQIAGWDSDARYVAAAYKWGTHVIVHRNISGGYSTNTQLYSGAASSSRRIVTSSNGAGETTYKPSFCHGRILIWMRIQLNCSLGEGQLVIRVNGKAQCSSCPAGHMSYGGVIDNAVCLPTLAYAVSQVTSSTSSSFTAEHDHGRVVRFRFSATAAPLVVYEDVRLEWAIDIKPNESSLDLQGTSACQQSHLSSATVGNETTLTVNLAFNDFNSDCELGLTTKKDGLESSGIFAVALLAVDQDGTVEGMLMQWYNPIIIKLTTNLEVVAVGGLTVPGGDPERGEVTNITADWAASSLIAYKNDRFESKKLLPIYQAGEAGYFELTLEDSLGQPGLVATPVRAWMAETSEPGQDMLHNLTDSIEILGHGSAGSSQAQFSVILMSCASCYIHIVAEISSRRLSEAYGIAEARQLLSMPSRTQHSLFIIANEVKDTNGGGFEDGRFLFEITLAVAAGVLIALVIASVSYCLLQWLRTKCRQLKYKHVAFDDPEEVQQS